jgi:hypothetical protein
MRFTDASLHNRIVLSSDGLAVGEITKLFIGSDLRIQAFEVKLRREVADRLGMRRTFLQSAILEISADAVQSVGDAVLLSVPLAAIRPQPSQHTEPEPVPQR